jgi:hypothetical protein
MPSIYLKKIEGVPYHSGKKLPIKCGDFANRGIPAAYHATVRNVGETNIYLVL